MVSSRESLGATRLIASTTARLRVLRDEGMSGVFVIGRTIGLLHFPLYSASLNLNERDISISNFGDRYPVD